MRYLKNILLIIVGICIISCEANVDASDLLKKDQLVVINGYLSPQDTTLKVQVSKSKSRATPKINNDELVVKNATVVLYDEEKNEVSLVYTDTSFNYEAPASDLRIIPGKKYFLKVIVDGKEYKASCTIPSKKVEKIDYKIEIKQSEFSSNRLLRLTIEDIKEQNDFYIVGATVTKSLNNVEVIDFELGQFATDISRENTIITADGYFTIFDGASQNSRLKIKVANTEKILYDALRTTYLNDSNDANPFSETVIAPNNINGENGFGVFAGYQLTEKEVTF